MAFPCASDRRRVAVDEMQMSAKELIKCAADADEEASKVGLPSHEKKEWRRLAIDYRRRAIAALRKAKRPQ